MIALAQARNLRVVFLYHAQTTHSLAKPKFIQISQHHFSKFTFGLIIIWILMFLLLRRKFTNPFLRVDTDFSSQLEPQTQASLRYLKWSHLHKQIINKQKSLIRDNIIGWRIDIKLLPMYKNYDHRNQGNQNSNNQHSIQLSQKKKKSISSVENNLSAPINLRKKFRPFRINIMDERRIELQNNRLLKRIGQINTRRNKNKLSLLYTGEREDDFMSLNQRSREACRIMKQKQIQMQNDNFVHRLVTRLHSYKSIIDNEEEKKNSHSKSRKKKYSSFNLPPISRKQL